MAANAQKSIHLKSPDSKLSADIVVGKTIHYSVSHQGDAMLLPSAISMNLADGTSFGIDSKLAGSSARLVNTIIDAAVYKKSKIVDNYNELTLRFKGDYSIIFRAYNDGIAYRFVSNKKQAFIVQNEQSEFNFPDDSKAYIPYVDDRNGANDTFNIFL